MRVAERVNLDFVDLDRDMKFLRQLGVTDLGIMIKEWDKNYGAEPAWYESPASGLRHTDYFELKDLRALKQWVESYGLRLYSIMGLNFARRVRLRPGEPGYAEAIENVKRSILNMGEVGIPQYSGGSRGFAGPAIASPFGLNHWRTSVVEGRGGAQMVRYSEAVARTADPAEIAPVSEEEVWSDTFAFLEQVSPVAAAAGVTLCHHPADPPVPVQRGVAKILKSRADFDRLFATVSGEANKMIFCLGWQEVRTAIRSPQAPLLQVPSPPIDVRPRELVPSGRRPHSVGCEKAPGLLEEPGGYDLRRTAQSPAPLAYRDPCRACRR
ncbi:mannonate dehydratase [Celeribacter indicus]|uniref:mannonate dehydratase n=1 Tax=Celeribacter indicus TaxID=1208324 RepID=A0A0B5E1L8_9RHOB|nr:mannonate dehydratase [Celeribacter indicus]AJE46362.1 mannonate dehydratase [Celeribacter indicus]SDW54570.1 mannonate dehydratase [Celeribacter indicus]